MKFIKKNGTVEEKIEIDQAVIIKEKVYYDFNEEGQLKELPFDDCDFISIKGTVVLDRRSIWER